MLNIFLLKTSSKLESADGVVENEILTVYPADVDTVRVKDTNNGAAAIPSKLQSSQPSGFLKGCLQGEARSSSVLV